MEEDDFYDRVNDYGDGKEDGGRHEGGFDKPCHTEKIGDSMSAETKILTDEQIGELSKNHLTAHAQFIGAGDVHIEGDVTFARAIEQAVLNSPDVVAMRKDLEEYVGIANELATENEALRKDAERYRHLKKDFAAFGIDMSGKHSWHWRGNPARLIGPNIDAAIDAAMEKQS